MPFGGLAVPFGGPRYSMRHAHAAFAAACSAVYGQMRRRRSCGAEERAGRARGAAVLRAVRRMAIECHSAGLRRHLEDLGTTCVTLTPPSRRHGQQCGREGAHTVGQVASPGASSVRPRA
eukprot:scaffold20444_cov71-Phaeocystis_antarctica.AAC.8